MNLIVFKLVLPALLILLASLAGRRWGDAIGGWLVGLPLTSGPVSAFLAIQYGPDFAAAATNGSLVGTAAQSCFCLIYVRLAGRGWLVALSGGMAAYAVFALIVQAMPLPHWGFFAVALAALAVSAKLIPRNDLGRTAIAAPWWDLPARMMAATALVVTLTAAGAVLGAKMAGVLASFPVFGAILAVFAHRLKGAAVASQVLRGMVLALFGFGVFFFVLGLLLADAGILPAFVAATASALLVQTGTLVVLRRGRAVKLA